MDIDLYRKLWERFWMLFVGIILVTTIGAMIFTATRSSSYEGSVYLSIAQQPQQTSDQSAFYEFGEYYSLQGSNFLADYFLGWLKDPATVNEILRRAGGGLPDKSLKTISRFFNAKSLGTVGVQVFHDTSSHEETEEILTQTKLVLQDRLTTLQEQGYYEGFAVVSGDVIVQEKQPNVVLSGAIGAVAGLLLAVFVLLILAVTVPERRA